MRFTSHSFPRLSALALAAMLGSAQGSPGMVVTGVSAGATVGQTAHLFLTIDLTEVVVVDGIRFEMGWDASGLSFDATSSTAFGQSWSGLLGLLDPSFVTITSAPGSYVLDAFLAAPLPLPAGSQTLNLAFTGLQEGTHAVTSTLDLVYDIGNGQLTVQGLSTDINISAVPEPTPTALLLGGLAMLGWLTRRRAA